MSALNCVYWVWLAECVWLPGSSYPPILVCTFPNYGYDNLQLLPLLPVAVYSHIFIIPILATTTIKWWINNLLEAKLLTWTIIILHGVWIIIIIMWMRRHRIIIIIIMIIECLARPISSVYIAIILHTHHHHCHSMYAVRIILIALLIIILLLALLSISIILRLLATAVAIIATALILVIEFYHLCHPFTTAVHSTTPRGTTRACHTACLPTTLLGCHSSAQRSGRCSVHC